MIDRTRAYSACKALARSHYENFPVASLLLPAAMRPHVAAVYAFARVADDLADEGTSSGGERRARLAAWQQQLHAAVDPSAANHAAATLPSPNDRGTLIIAAAARTIRSLDLPI